MTIRGWRDLPNATLWRSKGGGKSKPRAPLFGPPGLQRVPLFGSRDALPGYTPSITGFGDTLKDHSLVLEGMAITLRVPLFGFPAAGATLGFSRFFSYSNSAQRRCQLVLEAGAGLALPLGGLRGPNL